jgi:lycopene cyclase CruA
VGTIAKGFVRGAEPDQTDFDKAEILVSNDDARDHRQLLWEGFGGNARADEFATSLYFYDSVDSRADKSLFSLFERYFETLPSYKRAGAQWRVLKPYFGHHAGLRPGRNGNRRRTAVDNLLLIGDAAATAGTFSSGGLDAHARNLRRVTHLTELALKANLLDAESLAQINEGERSVSQLAGLRALMSPAARSAPSAVNESMNAVMAALHESDDSVRQDFFQDRLSTSGFKNLFVRTMKLYPRILQQVREHFGTRGTLWWLAGIAETMFNERRSKNQSEGNELASDANARDEFAKYVALYQNKHHADEP